MIGWLVIEELPDTHAGYQVVYDESYDDFGLATTDQTGKRLYLGSYGGLWDVLEGM